MLSSKIGSYTTFWDASDCYISRYVFEEYKRLYNYPKKGDVLISAAGTLGHTVVYDGEERYFQDSNIVWLANDESVVLNSYLYYYYKIIKWFSTTGSTINRLYNENIEGATIRFPSLEEQKRIVSVLKSIDDKININQKLIKELEETARLIYDYWLTQFDFPDENGKPYRSSGGKMVWNDELKREIPEGWDSVRVGDITYCLDSQRIPLSLQEREKLKPGEIPYYGATGIMDYVNEYIFDGDYVLVAEDGSVMDDAGLPIVQRVSGKAWINNHAHVLEPSKGHCCRLLTMILKDIPVIRIKTGSIQMKINQDNLNNALIVDISDELIEKINKVLLPIDAQILCLQENIERLISLRDWLLPMLMNGQVTVRSLTLKRSKR